MLKNWWKIILIKVFKRLGLGLRSELVQIESGLKSIESGLKSIEFRLNDFDSRQKQIEEQSLFNFKETENAIGILKNNQKTLESRLCIAKTKLCFVVPYSYSLFNSDTSFIFGGSEVRGWLLARGLANLGNFEVSFVVFDHGQGALEKHDGVIVIRGTSLSYSIKNSPEKITAEKNLNYPNKHEDYFSFISNIDADFYCIFGVHNLAAQIVRSCRKIKKQVILFAGSDNDFSSDIIETSETSDNYGRIAKLAYYTIQNVSHIIVQTNFQKEILKSRFGRECQILNNPVEFYLDTPFKKKLKSKRPICLWVGKSDMVKQPWIVLEIAKNLKEFDFVMVMNLSIGLIHEKILSNVLPNIKVIEWISYNDIKYLFETANYLINTSKHEGFPNSFLQAGISGLPIISLNVDPDNFIKKNRCGVIAEGNIQVMIDSIYRLENQKELYEEYSSNVFNYVLEKHEWRRISLLLENYISGLKKNS